MTLSLSLEPIASELDSAELDTLVQIARRTFTDAFGHNYTLDDLNTYLMTRMSAEAFQQELQEPGSQFYWMKLDDQVVGYLKWITPCQRYLDQIDRTFRQAFFLERFYLLEEAKGTGLGPVGMQFVITQAKRSKADALYLTVWEHNHRAQHFYQNFGFRTVGAIEFEVGNARDHEYVYALKL